MPVIFLDTGRLFAETLEYRTRLTDRLGLTDVRTVTPDPARLAANDPHRALWMTNPDLCCHIRKTEPLQRALDRLRRLVHRPQALPERAARRARAVRGRRRAHQGQPAGELVDRRPQGLCRPARPARASAGRQGLSLDRLRALHRRGSPPARTSAPAAGAASTRPSAASTCRSRPTAAAFEPRCLRLRACRPRDHLLHLSSPRKRGPSNHRRVRSSRGIVY